MLPPTVAFSVCSATVSSVISTVSETAPTSSWRSTRCGVSASTRPV
jgi:hypothetical protein